MNSQLELFHNTTDLQGADLRRREIRAGSQNAKILEWFRDNPEKLCTPFDVLRHRFSLYGCYSTAPITSIRRALTDLTSLGYLVKTEERRWGEYGKLNYCWHLA
jgi:hypothetical protein